MLSYVAVTYGSWQASFTLASPTLAVALRGVMLCCWVVKAMTTAKLFHLKTHRKKEFVVVVVSKPSESNTGPETGRSSSILCSMIREWCDLGPVTSKPGTSQ